jgi:hypothetical protein
VTTCCFRHVTRHGAFCVATTPSLSGGFLAWAKRGEIVAFDPVREPGDDVWFSFGATREQARAKLLLELGLSS